MAALGVAIALVSLLNIEIFGRPWQLHSMIAGALLLIVGTQVVALGLCAHAYGTYFMRERDPWFDRMRARFRLEHGLLVGGGRHRRRTARRRDHRRDLGRPRLRRALGEERLAVLAATLIIVGIQVFFTSFLLSILGLRRRG